MSGLRPRPRLPGRGARPPAERVCSRRRRAPRLWVVVVVVMPETRLLGSLSPGACQACSPKALPPSLSRVVCLPASPGRTGPARPPQPRLSRLGEPAASARSQAPWPVAESWLCRVCIQALKPRDPGFLRGSRQPHIPGSPQESPGATAHWPSCFHADPTRRLTPVAV